MEFAKTQSLELFFLYIPSLFDLSQYHDLKYNICANDSHNYIFILLTCSWIYTPLDIATKLSDERFIFTPQTELFSATILDIPQVYLILNGKPFVVQDKNFFLLDPNLVHFSSLHFWNVSRISQLLNIFITTTLAETTTIFLDYCNLGLL